jgi:hypothetical protein
MTSFYKIQGTSMIVNVDQLLFMSRDESRKEPPYVLRFVYAGNTISQVTFDSLEGLEGVERQLQDHLVQRNQQLHDLVRGHEDLTATSVAQKTSAPSGSNPARLPRRGLTEPQNRAHWEAVGARILDADADPANWFVSVDLPAGWRRSGSDTRDLVDERCRVRARERYQVPLDRDRGARIDLLSRFSILRVTSVWADGRRRLSYVVTDHDATTLFWAPGVTLYRPEDLGHEAVWSSRLNLTLERIAKLTCLTWLSDRGVERPTDPAAYWYLAIERADPADPGPVPRTPEAGGRVQTGIQAVRSARERDVYLFLGGSRGEPVDRQWWVTPDEVEELSRSRGISTSMFWIDRGSPPLTERPPVLDP